MIMNTSRREFLKNAGTGTALLTAGSVAFMGGAALFSACSPSGSEPEGYTRLCPDPVPNMFPPEFASGQLGKMDMKKYETVPMPGIPYIK
jgi:hypothetical protein